MSAQLFWTIYILSSVGITVTQNQEQEQSSKNFCINSSTSCDKIYVGHVDDVRGQYKEDSPAAKYQESQNWTFFLKKIEIAQENYARDKVKGQICDKDSVCTCGYGELISKDLKHFSGGITRELIDMSSSRGTLYQIRNHQLYREKNCKFPARCKGIEHFLLKIILELDDMEMVINVSDWPQVNSWSKIAMPVFSFSKTHEFLDIMYPAWTFWEGGPAISIYPRGLGRWDVFRKSLIQASKHYTWEKKKNSGFFRGSRTSSERDALILLSREYPDLIDAQYTKNQAWKSDADTLGTPAVEEITLEDHCRYKYLFNYRGVAASFRFKHLFLCKSLVFHVGEQWMEFFYSFLKPWIHYIPVDQYSSKKELRSLIEFTIQHDKISQEIAENGYELIKSRLKMSHVTCYWKKLLTHYSKLITYTVQPRLDLIRIV